MIFVTVGTQLPFDRLICGMDKWASDNDSTTVVAQIGNTQYIPQHMRYQKKLSISEFSDNFNNARLIISHAGMGTIITALETQKPLIIMPREFSLGEHRNDHQIATAEQFSHYDLIHVVKDLSKLYETINSAMSFSDPESKPKFEVSRDLVQEIDRVIQSS